MLQEIRSARYLPTLELFSSVWRCFLTELSENEQGKAVEYLRKGYMKEVPKEVLCKMYQLRSSPNMETKLLCADCWAGIFGTHPGSAAAGTQRLEPFQSSWQQRAMETMQDWHFRLDMFKFIRALSWESAAAHPTHAEVQQIFCGLWSQTIFS